MKCLFVILFTVLLSPNAYCTDPSGSREGESPTARGRRIPGPGYPRLTVDNRSNGVRGSITQDRMQENETLATVLVGGSQETVSLSPADEDDTPSPR
jgi:hypothetical protein